MLSILYSNKIANGEDIILEINEKWLGLLYGRQKTAGKRQENQEIQEALKTLNKVRVMDFKSVCAYRNKAVCCKLC